MVKNCAYGPCNSRQNSKSGGTIGAPGVFFIKFPSPKTDTLKCKQWVQACGRKNFSISKVSSNTFICSKHFIGFRGPTPSNPDPVPLIEVLSPHFVATYSNLSSTPITNGVKLIGNSKFRRKELCLDASTETSAETLSTTSMSMTINIMTIIPPSGWAMEILNPSVSFYKARKGFIVITCNFEVQEFEAIVTLKVLGNNFPCETISSNCSVKSNADILIFLKDLDKFGVCPGNDDVDLVNIYRKYRKNNALSTNKSYYSETMKAVYSKNCGVLYNKSIRSKKRCTKCTLYRSTLRKMRVRKCSRVKPVSSIIKKKTQLVKDARKKLINLKKSRQEIDVVKKLCEAKLITEKNSSFIQVFLRQQIKAMKSSKTGMRWDPTLLKWASYMKNKSKSAYEALRKTEAFALPCLRTLYNHRHILSNNSGFDNEGFLDMENLSNVRNLPQD